MMKMRLFSLILIIKLMISEHIESAIVDKPHKIEKENSLYHQRNVKSLSFDITF